MSASARKSFRISSLVGLAALLASTGPGCGGPARALIVKSDPAEATVCLKGRADSGYFSSDKVCVGTTPFDADRVEFTDAAGHRHRVKFKDVESDKESFYVIVSRPGFLPQAFDVPEWEHTVVLKRQ